MRRRAAHDPNQGRIWSYDAKASGAAEWADQHHLAQRGYGPHGAHLLGYLPGQERRESAVPITYSGHRHELILAPTRGGKGVSAGVPRLLEHKGSAIIMDIKGGENALLSARYRRDVLGQTIILIDPYDAAASQLGIAAARINPLAELSFDDPDIFDTAMQLAGAIVIGEGGSDSHWSAEAEALIAGLILYAVELGAPSLRDVRAFLNQSREDFASMVQAMMQSDHDLVRAAGARIDNKEERELSGVISTAQRNTHFLDSAALAESLSGNDLDLSRIGDGKSFYLVLHAHRTPVARRYLRLLIAYLMNAVMRLEKRPGQSVMFLLDEMASLHRMSLIEDGVALMAGMGMQFVMMVQDFSQLRSLYRERWETFIANSASIQCLGTNDRFTAEYLSALCGQGSSLRMSYETAQRRAELLGDPEWMGASDAYQPRKLISPDELMTLSPSLQLIKLAAARPVMAWRSVYYLDARFRDRRERPLFDIHPDHAGKALPRPIDFTRAGFDLSGVLGQHLRVG